MKIEAVILTGGASRRMGQDKASLLVDGIPMATRVVRSLLDIEVAVTALGRSSIEGAAFLEDLEEYAGPLSALAQFQPSAELVFVCSCDLPLFDARIVGLLANALGTTDCAVPVVAGFRQPLIALYRASAFEALPSVIETGKRSMMAWLDTLLVTEVSEDAIAAAGMDPRCLASANTPEELSSLLHLSPEG